jgi:hypothetical protein
MAVTIAVLGCAALLVYLVFVRTLPEPADG